LSLGNRSRNEREAGATREGASLNGGMEINKLIAACLVAGIVFFVAGLVGDNVIRVTVPAHTAINIATGSAPTAPSAPQVDPPIDSLLAQADAKRGEADTQKLGCIACHSFTKGGARRDRTQPVWRSWAGRMRIWRSMSTPPR